MVKNKFTNIISYRYFQDIIFIIILIIINGTYFFQANYLTQIDGDTAQHEYSLLAGMINIYRNKEVPLWYPYVWGGQNSFNALIPVFYPISIILGNMFYNTETKMLSYQVIQAYMTTYIIILSVGIYYMLRVFGHKTKVAFTIAILISFSHTIVSMYAWLRLLHAISWIPFSISFLKRIYKYPYLIRYYILFGISFSMSVFAQASYGALLSTLCIGIFFIVHLFDMSYNKKKKLDLFKNTFIAYVTGIIFSSPMMFPFIESVRKSYRVVPGITDYNFSGKIPYEIYSSLHIEITNIRDMIIGKGPGFLSVSLLLSIFLIIGIFSKNRKDSKILNFGICIIIFVIFCGSGIVFSNYMYYIPFFDSFKPLILYASIFYIGVSVVASEGLSNYLEYLNDLKNKKKDLFYNKALLSSILIFTIIYNYLPINYNSNQICLVIITTIIALTFLLKDICKLNVNRYMLSALFILGIYFNSQYFDSEWTLNKIKTEDVVRKVEKVNSTLKRELSDQVLNNIEKARILPWSNTLPYPQNFFSIIGFNDSLGYFNPVYKKSFDIHMFVSLEKRSILQNIKYILTDNSPENKSTLDWLKEIEFKDYEDINIFKQYDDNTESKVKILKSEFSKGLAWMVYDFDFYDNNTELQRIMDTINNIDLNNKAIINRDTISDIEIQPLKNESNIQSNIEVAEYKTNYLSLNVTTEKDGILVFSETYYPGWTAFVDGKKVNIMEVNHAFRGLLIKSGTHTVKMRFFPKTLIISISILVFTLFIYLFIYLKGRR